MIKNCSVKQAIKKAFEELVAEQTGYHYWKMKSHFDVHGFMRYKNLFEHEFRFKILGIEFITCKNKITYELITKWLFKSTFNEYVKKYVERNGL